MMSQGIDKSVIGQSDSNMTAQDVGTCVTGQCGQQHMMSQRVEWQNSIMTLDDTVTESRQESILAV